MGDRALLVSGMPDPAAWASALAQRRGSDRCIVTPAAQTVLVVCDSPTALARTLPTLQTIDASVELPSNASTQVKIPVLYDGADLTEVAQMTGLTGAEVVALHSEGAYTVAFCGFSPGFAYLRGLPNVLHLPRRSSPRTLVPAGSVAIASEFSAVYPRASPGGWHLLGTTSETLFDGSAGSPSLLRPGDRVRFVPVPSLPVPTAVLPRLTPPEDGAFTVIDAGVASSIQDLGRGGFEALGVSSSGMVDPVLGAATNRFVGNPPGAALIETCGGLMIRANRPLIIASSETIAPTTLAAGDAFRVHGGRGRRWHYLAIRGGIQAEQVLGSSSTDTLSGLGPPPLTTGQSLDVGRDPVGPTADSTPISPVASRVRIHPGPRLNWFSARHLQDADVKFLERGASEPSWHSNYWSEPRTDLSSGTAKRGPAPWSDPSGAIGRTRHDARRSPHDWRIPGRGRRSPRRCGACRPTGHRHLRARRLK